MKCRQIVLDTNVLVSALRSKRGASHSIFQQINSGKFDINLSVSLVLEYEEAAKRVLKDLLLNENDIEDIIDYLCSVGNRKDIHFLWRPFLKDPDDDMILEIAVSSQCDAIVTHNVSDFSGAETLGIRILTPREFLQEIGD